jgi:hypothetical protein
LYLIKQKSIVKTFFIRGVFLSKKFTKNNKRQVLVYLRSPKHFNIGKQKIFSFKNQTNFTQNNLIFIPYFFILKSHNFFFLLIKKLFKFNPLYRINSLRISIKTNIL